MPVLEDFATLAVGAAVDNNLATAIASFETGLDQREAGRGAGSGHRKERER